ncbi:hypothetical protein H8959_018872, partial [Pygathrix nigripes]
VSRNLPAPPTPQPAWLPPALCCSPALSQPSRSFLMDLTPASCFLPVFRWQ